MVNSDSIEAEVNEAKNNERNQVMKVKLMNKRNNEIRINRSDGRSANKNIW